MCYMGSGNLGPIIAIIIIYKYIQIYTWFKKYAYTIAKLYISSIEC